MSKPVDPPSYEESEKTNKDQEYTYPEEKNEQSFQNGQMNPMDDPNVYKVPPQLVNISQANPQHLNPSYPEFQQREQERWAHGDVPRPDAYKHGAPLAPSHKGTQRTGGGAFPGRGGATYNNAARR